MLNKEDRDEIVYFLKELYNEWTEQEVDKLVSWSKRYEALDRRIAWLERLNIDEVGDV